MDGQRLFSGEPEDLRRAVPMASTLIDCNNDCILLRCQHSSTFHHLTGYVWTCDSGLSMPQRPPATAPCPLCHNGLLPPLPLLPMPAVPQRAFRYLTTIAHSCHRLLPRLPLFPTPIVSFGIPVDLPDGLPMPRPPSITPMLISEWLGPFLAPVSTALNPIKYCDGSWRLQYLQNAVHRSCSRTSNWPECSARRTDSAAGGPALPINRISTQCRA